MPSFNSIPVPPCVILLNGYPGVGKLTIGKKIRETLRESISHRLVDRYLLLEAANTIEPGGTLASYQLIEEFRCTAFDGLKLVEEKNLVVIMTSCLAATTIDLNVFIEYACLARARGVPLVSVNINCDESVNITRLCSNERKEAVLKGKTKIINAGTLSVLRQNYSMIDPMEFKEEFEEEGCNIHHLELDTSNMAVHDATECVLDFVRGCGSRDGKEAS